MQSKCITKIRRGSKRYCNALETAHDVYAYTLRNGFRGEKIDADALIRYMIGEEVKPCELMTDGEGSFQLHVHSNCWFQLEAQS